MKYVSKAVLRRDNALSARQRVLGIEAAQARIDAHFGRHFPAGGGAWVGRRRPCVRKRGGRAFGARRRDARLPAGGVPAHVRGCDTILQFVQRGEGVEGIVGRVELYIAPYILSVYVCVYAPIHAHFVICVSLEYRRNIRFWSPASCARGMAH